MNGYACSCGLWMSTPRTRAIHNKPVSKNGETTSEHKHMLNAKQLYEIETTVEDARHE